MIQPRHDNKGPNFVADYPFRSPLTSTPCRPRQSRIYSSQLLQVQLVSPCVPPARRGSDPHWLDQRPVARLKVEHSHTVRAVVQPHHPNRG